MSSKKFSEGSKMPKYTKHVGEKFNKDGSPRYFPGATIISHLESNQKIYKLMSKIQRDAMDESFSEYYTFLPPSSFHMTVFDLYSDFERYHPKWSTKIDRLLSAQEVNLILKQDFETLSVSENFEMAVDYVAADSIKLTPATEKCSEELILLRDSISKKTGIRFPNHDDYQFHMTFAYLLKELNENTMTDVRRFISTQTTMLKKQLPVFTIRKPCFRVYTTMEAFVPFPD